MAKAAGRLSPPRRRGDRSRLVGFFLFLAAPFLGSGAAHAQPNVILFLVDDQGWADTSLPMDPSVPDSMSDYHETPRLEVLAAEGTRFSAAYAPAPICSPSRVSIETGLSPASLHVTNNIETAIPPARMTIPEIIKAERPEYGTAHFGKWHEAWGSTPGDHGYDQHNGGLPYPTLGHDPLTNPKDVEAITQLAENFIEAQVASGNPFYLVVSHHAVHVPLAAFPATLDYYLQKPPGTRHTLPVYAALTQDLDTALGRILDKLDDLQIEDETYLIYMSDNGGLVPFTSNLPLRDGKGTLWEGGVRVPFVVSGPGVIAGRVETEKPAVGWDLMPTILDWIGVTHALPPDAEGESLRGALEGTAGGSGCTSADDRTLVWHSPHQPAPRSAIRRQTCAGTYKLIRLWAWPYTVQLFDLGSDWAESNDLVATEPALAAELEQELSAYLAQVGSPCPNYDPNLGPRCPALKPKCGLGYELPLLLLPFLAWRRRSERATPAT